MLGKPYYGIIDNGETCALISPKGNNFVFFDKRRLLEETEKLMGLNDTKWP